jgi:hypothetical protein
VKLQGLADYAERYSEAFERIEAAVKEGSAWQVLDLQRADVRAAIVNHSGDVAELYRSHRSRRHEQTTLDLK